MKNCINSQKKHSKKYRKFDSLSSLGSPRIGAALAKELEGLVAENIRLLEEENRMRGCVRAW